jgi:hypothetical protein
MQIWKLWEAAPAGRAPLPPGPWRNADTAPLHGVWAKPEPSGRETVVVANHGHLLLGWQVPRQRWQFASELVRASNCALAQVPWLWRQHGRLVTTDPYDTAVGLVLAGRKPVAQAASDDDTLADRWAEAALAAGHAVRRERVVFDCGPVPRTCWFVHVAVRGTAAERFDLDALLGDYAACLPPGAFTDVERAVSDLHDRELAELLEDPDLIMAAAPGELARTGLVLGYHPATTAALVLGAPSTSWAADEDGALMVELAEVAARTSLPGLPSAFGDDRQGVP